MTEQARITHYRASALDRQGLGDCPLDCIGVQHLDRGQTARYIRHRSVRKAENSCILCFHAIASETHPLPRLSHNESTRMSEATDKIIALNVRLKPSESSANLRATSHTDVGLAQGIADVDFGFIEPALLAAIAKTAKDGQAVPKGLDGTLVTRVATGWTC